MRHLLILLLFAAQLQAQRIAVPPPVGFLAPEAAPAKPDGKLPYIVVPRECRVGNVNGNCGWVSVETCCRFLHIEAGYGLGNGRHASTPGSMKAVLDSRGIKYRMQGVGNPSTALIEQAVGENKPCMVGVNGNHAVVCVGRDAEGFYIIDNTGPWGGKLAMWPEQWFRQRFDGWTCVVDSASAAPSQPRPGGPRLVPEDGRPPPDRAPARPPQQAPRPMPSPPRPGSC